MGPSVTGQIALSPRRHGVRASTVQTGKPGPSGLLVSVLLLQQAGVVVQQLAVLGLI